MENSAQIFKNVTGSEDASGSLLKSSGSKIKSRISQFKKYIRVESGTGPTSVDGLFM